VINTYRHRQVGVVDRAGLMMAGLGVVVARFFAALECMYVRTRNTGITNQFVQWSGNHPREPCAPDDGQTWGGRNQAFCRSATGINSYAGRVGIVLENRTRLTMDRLGVVVNRISVELQASVINSYAERVGIIVEIRARLMNARLGMVVARFFTTL
jgi:hypothetical protein